MGGDADHAAGCACGEHGASALQQTLGELDFGRSLSGAASCNDVKRMRELLARGHPVNGDQEGGGKRGHCPLHYAARSGHVEACRILLQSGAAVDARTAAGRATSLHRAAAAGHAAVVHILLQHGADAAALDADGQTPLHRARAAGQRHVAAALAAACSEAEGIRDHRGRLPSDWGP